jgi:PTH1 family peptidyl-tRNA hydrolase
MTKLIVGLGNPGPRYSHTRHNVGFSVVSALGERHRIRGRSRGPSIVGEGEIAGQAVVLAQPTTMMNLSGKAVAQLVRSMNLRDLQNLLVVYDEMDLPLGTLRLRARGSAGGHNGIKSVIHALGTQDFPRLRVGVSRPPPDLDPVDYVLTRFRPEEKPVLEQAISAAADAIEWWVHAGTDDTMNRFNQWRAPALANPSQASQEKPTGDG